jgi:L-amino acid N-acyltransferase YncA
VPPPPQPAAIRRATDEDLDRVVDLLWADAYRGLGSALLDAGLEWAAGAAAHNAALLVSHNEAGLALYRSRGFVEEGRLVRHYRRTDGQLWGAVIMGRRLDETTGRAERPASSGSESEPNNG